MTKGVNLAYKQRDKSDLQRLSQINLEDMCKAIGINNSLLKASLTPFLMPHASKLAKEVLHFDKSIKATNLQEASKHFCGQYTKNVEAMGLETLPATGPLLILSNHPGLFDTVSLFSQMSRADLKIIALDRPFLRAMPALNEALFFVPSEQQKTALVRKATRHLQAGGSILTFPAGQIEPDPYLREGTLKSVETWSGSILHLKQMVPDLSIVIAMVAGVFNKRLLNHPLVKIKQTTEAKEHLAATLQVASKGYQTNTITIAFSQAIMESDKNVLKKLLSSSAKDCLDKLKKMNEDAVHY